MSQPTDYFLGIFRVFFVCSDAQAPKLVLAPEKRFYFGKKNAKIKQLEFSVLEEWTESNHQDLRGLVALLEKSGVYEKRF